jgi:hypothetical protein
MSPSQFSSLLKPSQLDKLKAAVKAQSKDSNREDEGYWKPTLDKAGNGSAIIRFLPAPPPETMPFAMYYRHAFQGPNGWYIENSRTSVGESDPLGDYNTRLWSTKNEDLMNQARKQSRKKTYVANIYVIQDKANPDNEGKVFLYRFGKKIFDKIQKVVEPEFEGDEPMDPFHVIDGANFRLRQKKQGGYPNYDDSMFETSSPLLKGDETAILKVLEHLKSVSEEVNLNKFKSYEDLKKKLDKVMGFDTGVYLTPTDAGTLAVPPSDSYEFDQRSTSPRPTTPAPVSNTWTPPSIDDDDSDVDSRLSQFDDE